MDKSYLYVIDYVIFAATLFISLGIGIFYSLRQKAPDEYMHGRHSIGLLPVCLSLAVSCVSAVSIQGNPAEVYLYGLDITFCTLGAIFGTVVAAFTFLPLYFELKLTSVFEYLEMRYESKVPRLLGSAAYILNSLLWNGFVLYGPAVATEAVLGIPTDVNIICMGLVCAVYTAIGGIRGVIWADVFQAVIMVVGLVAMLIYGFIQVGFTSFWEKLHLHGRTDLNFNLSIFQRSSTWIFIIGYTTRFLCGMSDQFCMVRYTGLPTLFQSKLSLLLSVFLITIFLLLTMSLGAVIFVYYALKGCDPLASGKIYSANQILPYFTKEIINFPGPAGLLTATFAAAALSTASSIQNSLVTIIWADFISPRIKVDSLSDFKKALILKVIALFCGILGICIAYIAKYSDGTLTEISAIANGTLQAPIFGMFLLGACFTFTSASTAVFGSLCGALCCFFLSIGSHFHQPTWKKPTMINSSCFNDYINTTSVYSLENFIESSTPTESSYYYNSFSVNPFSETQNSPLDYIFSISPYAYEFIGTSLAVLFGLLASIIPKFRHKQKVSPKFLFPFLRSFIKVKRSREINESLMQIKERDIQL